MRQDITISDGTVVHTLDAFPFDSSPTLVTTVQGYRRGDRAVDAWTMQRTFAQFFSDGVFGTPADAFQIAKASSGLAVTIQPGMAVIQGAMGGIKESDGALTVTLDTAAAAGNVCYGIMLRYDNNSDVRSLGIRVVKGVAGSNPQPPAPDTTSAGVMELRLGYVTVPNGATDLSNATVTNEKGLAVCPYAAPFEEIDMSEVTADARASANAAMVQLLAYFDQYKGAVDAALDDSEATYLQQQISALQEQISALDIDLSDEVDNETIEYASDNYPTTPKKMRVKDGGIDGDKIANGFSLPSWISAEGRYLRSVANGIEWSPGEQVLWEGSAQNGAITVTGLSDYKIICVETAQVYQVGGNKSAKIYAMVFDDLVYGVGFVYAHKSPVKAYRGRDTLAVFMADRDGDTITANSNYVLGYQDNKDTAYFVGMQTFSSMTTGLYANITKITGVL